MKCLILCGGKNSRMNLETAKVLLEINGKPLIKWVMEFWQRYGIDDFVFLTGYHAPEVEKYIKSLGKNYPIVRGEGLSAFALDILKTEHFMGDKFIVAMGDCFMVGKFDADEINNYRFGVGVISADKEEVKINYGVTVVDGEVKGLREHPKQVEDWHLCGMGAFLMGKEIYQAIKNTSVSGETGNVEFIDAIRTVVDNNYVVKALKFDGIYINMNTRKEYNIVKSLMELKNA